MAIEIERKFLVANTDYKAMASHSEPICQGYLSVDPDRTVRVRIKGEHGFLTVKSRTHGLTRGEWEYEIPVGDARELLALCPNPLEKRRWYVEYEGHVWEVDEFGGSHAGLCVAEVELQSADETVTVPGFIGREVTGDPRYYNSSLSQ
ncbi:MAG: CYTH domain-containing protein [Muribaculaceae bacterium]